MGSGIAYWCLQVEGVFAGFAEIPRWTTKALHVSTSILPGLERNFLHVHDRFIASCIVLLR